jgi:NADH-quinone oxidoreductase subunit L
MIEQLLPWIPGLPLLAAIICALFGKRVLGEKSHIPVVLALAGSFLLSVALLRQVHQQAGAESAKTSIGFEKTVDLWQWATVKEALPTPEAALPTAGAAAKLPEALDFNVAVTLRADPLTCIMLCMVTFISTLVAIYASGYMHGDPGYSRFFAYIGLFVFSMTMLVSVSNFVLLYVFWEAVGVCSYLLIGFWYEKPEAAAAGKKAFLVNRIGDFGFALALFLLWTTYGTLNFHDAHGVAGILGQTRLALPSSYVTGGVATAICCLLMLGACGKSAQFPLHVWLPDAMEGPTPVSALIHAATMVTAGVYMVTRCTPLFQVSETAQQVVACIGCITAVMAGFIAITQTDLKRVLAYSTVSQLGFMFLGLGTGMLPGIVAGMFHLFTHAFFKALLFLGAGSVMHAMGGVIDMRRFSGLKKIMPSTHWTFLFGCLALAGVVPFAGFWSKDAILAAVHEKSERVPLYGWLYWIAVATAFMTAMYTFRAFFMTFYGPEKIPHEAGHHAHESPKNMTLPLMILAVCALVVGAYFELTHGFAHFLAQTPSLAYSTVQATGELGQFHLSVAILSTMVALGGIGVAAYYYLGSHEQVTKLAKAMLPLYLLSRHKLYFDELYQWLLVKPLLGLASLAYVLDRYIVDGLVDAVGALPPLVGREFRSMQAGMVQTYALATVLGMALLFGVILRVFQF